LIDVSASSDVNSYVFGETNSDVEGPRGSPVNVTTGDVAGTPNMDLSGKGIVVDFGEKDKPKPPVEKEAMGAAVEGPEAAVGRKRRREGEDAVVGRKQSRECEDDGPATTACGKTLKLG
jgi:hypothetical protein